MFYPCLPFKSTSKYLLKALFMKKSETQLKHAKFHEFSNCFERFHVVVMRGTLDSFDMLNSSASICTYFNGFIYLVYFFLHCVKYKQSIFVYHIFKAKKVLSTVTDDLQHVDLFLEAMQCKQPYSMH